MRQLPPNMPNDRQAGAVLVISLMFLVVLTMLGLGMFLSTNSEEKMARNFRDKEIALQAAEAALNEAKMLITGSYDLSAPPSPIPRTLSSANCYVNTPAGFTCNQTTSPSVDLFATGTPPGANVGTYNTSTSPAVTGLFVQPRYLIVKMPSSFCGASNSGDCYQIIAQARGRLSTTRVNLVEVFTN